MKTNLAQGEATHASEAVGTIAARTSEAVQVDETARMKEVTRSDSAARTTMAHSEDAVCAGQQVLVRTPGGTVAHSEDAVCVGGAAGEGCTCHHKETPRSAELQADLQKRLNRVIGQLNGVKAMIDENRYCGDVLTQLSAAESAVHSISAIMLQNHLETCVVEQIERGNAEIIDEAMQLIKKFAR